MRVLALATLAALLLGCDGRQNLVPLDWGLDRMIEQPRADPYGPSAAFPDGAAMQPPPFGSVPWRAPVGREAILYGTVAGEPVDRIPLPIDRPLLERGRVRFERFCAPCHGIDGSGGTVVARNMERVRPPSFHSETIRSRPAGHLYRVVSEGYGMMPRYAWQLGIEERWAVVAWVRVLQRSQHVALDELPPRLLRRAREELPP